MMSRVGILGVYKNFIRDLKKSRAFNVANQTDFSERKITKEQFYMLTEFIFFNMHREYENFIRDLFLLYSLEKKRVSGKKPKSFLKPKDISHAENMIRSDQRFLDWNSPETIIKRSELFLKNDTAFKTAYSSNTLVLNNYKKIRNQIAHYSSESTQEYNKVLQLHFGVTPLSPPPAGEFLNQTSKINSSNNIIEDYFDLIENIAKYLK
jgi:hypothetical protein